MGDRVAVLKDGLLQQVAPPRRLYDDPVNTFVAGFIGSPGMNLIDAELGPDGAAVGGARVPVPRSVVEGATRSADGGPGARVTVGLRPEGWTTTAPDAPGAAGATVTLLEELGAESLLYAQLDGAAGQSPAPVVVRIDRRAELAVGEAVGLVPTAAEALFFDVGTGDRLR